MLFRSRIFLPEDNSLDDDDNIDLAMPDIVVGYTESEILDPVVQPHSPPPITLPPPPPPPPPPLSLLSPSLHRRLSITALETYPMSSMLSHGPAMSFLEYATFPLSAGANITSSDSPFPPPLHILTVLH